jgi:hypothetical protein
MARTEQRRSNPYRTRGHGDWLGPCRVINCDRTRSVMFSVLSRTEARELSARHSDTQNRSLHDASLDILHTGAAEDRTASRRERTSPVISSMLMLFRHKLSLHGDRRWLSGPMHGLQEYPVWITSELAASGR